MTLLRPFVFSLLLLNSIGVRASENHQTDFPSVLPEFEKALLDDLKKHPAIYHELIRTAYAAQAWSLSTAIDSEQRAARLAFHRENPVIKRLPGCAGGGLIYHWYQMQGKYAGHSLRYRSFPTRKKCEETVGVLRLQLTRISGFDVFGSDSSIMDYRTWADDHGNQMFAKFVDYSRGRAVFDTSTGRTVRIAPTKLTTDDEALVRQWIRNRAENRRKLAESESQSL